METTDKVDKVRILEKDFPARIPVDIWDKPLEVINEAGETVALFYDTSFMKEKYTDPMEYIKHHDDIFKNFDIWTDSDWWEIENDSGEVEDDDEKNERETKVQQCVEQYPDIDWHKFREFEDSKKSIIALCRLAYPYQLHDYQQVMMNFEVGGVTPYGEILAEIVLNYKDPRLIAKLPNVFLELNDVILKLNHESLMLDEYKQAKSTIQGIIENDYTKELFSQPDLFLPNKILIYILKRQINPKTLSCWRSCSITRPKVFRND